MVILFACTGPGPETGREPDGSGSDSVPDSDTGTTTETDTDSGTTDTSPVDADGDGFFSAERGGDDCDDAQAWVHPGAEEWCDGIDQDCDGEALAPGVCGKEQDWRGSAVWLCEEGDDLRIVDDVTGDGAADLLWLYGNYALFAGPLDPPYDEDPYAGDHEWGTGSYTVEMLLASSDIDGDGVNDLVFPVQDCLTGCGVLIQWGPIPVDQGYDGLNDVATFWLSGADPELMWGQGVATGADLDGDGAGDIAAFAYSLGEGDSFIDVMFGLRSDTRDAVQIHPRDSGGVHDLPLLPDMDGDGLGELISSVGDEEPRWLAGGDLRAADGADADDIASGTLGMTAIGAAGGNGYGPLSYMSVDDWDGDGLPNLLNYGEDETGELQVVYHFGSLAPGTNPPIGQLATGLDNAGGVYLRQSLADGGEFILHPDGAEQVLIARTGPLLGTEELSDLPTLSYACLDGDCPMFRFGADVTGDGLRDGHSIEKDDNGDWATWIFPGFEIPWDDPSYW